jgi:C4-dicarboxylate-specific signal transduction histidine kinase
MISIRIEEGVAYIDRRQADSAIIINLVTNAIATMQRIDRQPLLNIRIRNAEGGRASTEFIDHGCVLPDGRANRMFDAFVSTKENGMSIGPATSRSIVQAN